MADIPRHQRPTRLKKLLFGVAYYPEHWTAAERAGDPARMAAAGVNVVRMGEFAWSVLEPRRGRFDFALFDETIAAMAAAGIETIFCTPTPTPPAWLTQGHDDWMGVNELGQRCEHGSRQHVCYGNDQYRAESRRIAAKLAAHFAGNPHVIGWQTDNEYHNAQSVCYCDSCCEGFRRFLRAKYGDIDALNRAWGTAVWSVTYDDFGQIMLPRPKHPRPNTVNPSAELDFCRFQSSVIVEFNRQQARILRRQRPDWFVMHNGMFSHVDFWRLTEDLDFLATDIYPGFFFKTPQDYQWAAHGLSRCRAASGGFIVPEQQSGPGAWRTGMLPTLPPGQMRCWAWQSVAHGADGLLHFRWRTARFGPESYWMGVLDHDDVPRRRFREFAQEGGELRRIGPRILHSAVDMQAAVAYQFDQEEAFSTLACGLPSCWDQSMRAALELWKKHLPAGYVELADSFAGLKLLILPSLPLIDTDLAARLEAFVRGGGVLLATARTATRDRNNHVLNVTPPGLLTDLFGCQVEEFGKIEPGSVRIRLRADAPVVPSGALYEILSLRGGRALGRWEVPESDGPSAVRGEVAVSMRRVGDGVAIYAGTFFTPRNAAAIVNLALAQAKVRPLARASESVEAVRRKGGDADFLFLLNHDVRPRTAQVGEGVELITGRKCSGKWKLEPYGVAVIEEASGPASPRARVARKRHGTCRSQDPDPGRS